MLRTLKAAIRDALPRRYQVPLKFWYSKLRGDLEGEMTLLPKLINPTDRVIDIGANRGVYAYILARIGARVELFEPNPVCCQILAAWSARQPNVSLHPVALSDHEGSAKLQIPVDDAGVENDASASIEKSGSGQFRERVVTLTTLDSFQFRQVALIKIDVEGHEFSVVEGAQSTIASNKPALLIEIEQRHNSRPITEIFERVTAFGYEGFFMNQGRLRELPEFNLSAHQIPGNLGGKRGVYINNFLFLHHSRLVQGDYAHLGLDRLK